MNAQHCGWDLGHLATSNYAASLCHTRLFISVSTLISSLLDWNHLHPFGNLEKNILRERYPCPHKIGRPNSRFHQVLFCRGVLMQEGSLQFTLQTSWLHDMKEMASHYPRNKWGLGNLKILTNKLSKFGKHPLKNSLGCLCYWIKFQIFFLNNYKLLNLATKSIAGNLKNRNS